MLRLRGSQAEMGRQFGTYCSEAGRHEAALQLYADRPTMAARMVAAGLPFAVRHGVERAADAVFAVQRRRLHRERTRRFPEFVARTEAGFEPLGRSDADVDAVFVMDVLQNAVGTIGRTSMFHHAEVAAAAMCSSVAVWGGATASGDLLHARNFDFPGATIWDLAPTIVFCEPVDGLRYGFVTTNGVDAPGITCWNEAGLTLTVHTRFHRDVRWSGPSVIDLGHEIIRSSDTIEAAVACARVAAATAASSRKYRSTRQSMNCALGSWWMFFWNGKSTSTPATRIELSLVTVRTSPSMRARSHASIAGCLKWKKCPE